MAVCPGPAVVKSLLISMWGLQSLRAEVPSTLFPHVPEAEPGVEAWGGEQD